MGLINSRQAALNRLAEAWRASPLMRNTFAMTLGMAGRTLGQGVIFVVVARLLGVQGYGAYAAVLAMSSVVGGFVGVGAPTVMMREVARSPVDFGRVWGRVLLVVAASLPILIGIYGLFTWIVLPKGISLLVIMLIGVAEMVFAPLTLVAIQAFQGHDLIGRASLLIFLPVIPRLAGVAILVIWNRFSPSIDLLMLWAWIYATTSALTMVCALFLVRRDLGCAVMPSPREVRSMIAQGVPFAFGTAASRLYADIDKTLVARLASFEAAGAYSAGYRVTDFAMVPLYALLTSATARFFKVGESGVSESLKYGRYILPIPIFYAVAAGVLLYYASGLLPMVLGDGYRSAVPVLQWMSWLPLIALPRLLLQSLLIGADHQNPVVAILGLGAILNILLNLLMIPWLGWRGAVIATYFVEIVMTVCLILFSGMLGFYRRSDKS